MLGKTLERARQRLRGTRTDAFDPLFEHLLALRPPWIAVTATSVPMVQVV